MKRNERLKKKLNNWLYDHYNFKIFFNEFYSLIISLLAGFIFSFGFVTFITPMAGANPYFKVATGGVGGLSQNLALFLKIISNGKISLTPTLIEGLGYTLFNLPLLVFSFLKIGKRFSIYSAINVIASSIFIIALPLIGLDKFIGTNPLVQNNIIARIIFGAICTGLASGLAFKGEFSCGGIDIITYYISLRKSTNVGKYIVIGNSIIISLYALLLALSGDGSWSDSALSIFFSVIYLFITSMVVDALNKRNNKVQLQFVTTNKYLSEVLLANFPHGGTLCKAEGAYSHTDRIMLYMVVSSNETKKVIELARKVDPKIFITSTPLNQVYGNFFIKPIE